MKRNIILSTIFSTVLGIITGGLYYLGAVIAPVSVSIYVMFIGTIYIVLGSTLLLFWAGFCIMKQLIDDVQDKHYRKKG
jgi:hypothetical protein